MAGFFIPVRAWNTQGSHAYATTHDPKLIQSTLGHSDISSTVDLYVAT